MKIKSGHLFFALLISLSVVFSATTKACSVDFGSMKIPTEDRATCIFYDTTSSPWIGSSAKQEVTKANSDSYNNESTASASGFDYSTEGNGSGLTVAEGVDSRLSHSLDVNLVNSLSQE